MNNLQAYLCSVHSSPASCSRCDTPMPLEMWVCETSFDVTWMSRSALEVHWRNAKHVCSTNVFLHRHSAHAVLQPLLFLFSVSFSLRQLACIHRDTRIHFRAMCNYLLRPTKSWSAFAFGVRYVSLLSFYSLMQWNYCSCFSVLIKDDLYLRWSFSLGGAWSGLPEYRFTCWTPFVLNGTFSFFLGQFCCCISSLLAPTMSACNDANE